MNSLKCNNHFVLLKKRKNYNSCKEVMMPSFSRGALYFLMFLYIGWKGISVSNALCGPALMCKFLVNHFEDEANKRVCMMPMVYILVDWLIQVVAFGVTSKKCYVQGINHTYHLYELLKVWKPKVLIWGNGKSP